MRPDFGLAFFVYIGRAAFYIGVAVMPENEVINRLFDRFDEQTVKIAEQDRKLTILSQISKTTSEDVKEIKRHLYGKKSYETRISILEEKGKLVYGILAALGLQLVGLVIWGITHLLEFLTKST